MHTMGGFLATAIERLYGAGFLADMTNILRQVTGALGDFYSGKGIVSAGYTVFSAIAASFLVLCFFLELVDMAMRDLFTLEKLITAFIKLLAGCAVILCSQAIINGMLQIGENLFRWLGQENGPLGAFMTEGLGIEGLDADTLATQIMEGAADGTKWLAQLRLFVTHFDWVFSALLVFLCSWALRIAGYFLALSALVMLGVRCFFAPVAVVQIFTGTHSAGIRYLKSILAEACTLAGMLVIVFVATSVGTTVVNGMMGSATIDSCIQAILDANTSTAAGDTIVITNVKELLGVGRVAVGLLPQVAAIGGMAGVSRILHDVFQ